MKTIEKFFPIAIGLFGLANIVASFFTSNYWQGIAGMWMIIAIVTFNKNAIVCPAANCCQNDKEVK